MLPVYIVCVHIFGSGGTGRCFTVAGSCRRRVPQACPQHRYSTRSLPRHHSCLDVTDIVWRVVRSECVTNPHSEPCLEPPVSPPPSNATQIAARLNFFSLVSALPRLGVPQLQGAGPPQRGHDVPDAADLGGDGAHLGGGVVAALAVRGEDGLRGQQVRDGGSVGRVRAPACRLPACQMRYCCVRRLPSVLLVSGSSTL